MRVKGVLSATFRRSVSGGAVFASRLSRYRRTRGVQAPHPCPLPTSRGARFSQVNWSRARGPASSLRRALHDAGQQGPISSPPMSGVKPSGFGRAEGQHARPARLPQGQADQGAALQGLLKIAEQLVGEGIGSPIQAWPSVPSMRSTRPSPRGRQPAGAEPSTAIAPPSLGQSACARSRPGAGPDRRCCATPGYRPPRRGTGPGRRNWPGPWPRSAGGRCFRAGGRPHGGPGPRARTPPRWRR